MPIYVYRCPVCEEEYEQLRSMSKRNEPYECCGVHCVRVFVPTDFTFKNRWIPTKDGWKRGEGPCDL